MFGKAEISVGISRRLRLAIILSSGSILLAACGGTSTSGTSNQSANTGKVNMSYAGSLVGAMTNDILPQFKKKTGIDVVGYPGGSVALANQIKEKLRQADLFLSAVPSVNSMLEGKANGNILSWYSDLASSPLVIGYNPKSKLGSELTASNWYKVMQTPGFRLGRTDPKLDPKGVLTETLVREEAKKVGDSSLFTKILGSAENSSQIFPEETLVGRLESGQLDAGFFYENEAKLAKIPFIKTGINLGANFTISILNNAKNRSGAVAFVNYLYSPQGQKELKSVGLIPDKAKVHGSGVPRGVKL
jgi:molybdate/tungstate transport system substrate-binding protein